MTFAIKDVWPTPSVSVGWDNDRATFFAQVVQAYIDADGNEFDADRVRMGTTPYEVRSAAEAINAVREWAAIPDGLEDQLEADAGQPQHRVATLPAANTGTLLWSEGLLTDWSEPEPVSVWGTLALSNDDTDDDPLQRTGVHPFNEFVDELPATAPGVAKPNTHPRARPFPPLGLSSAVGPTTEVPATQANGRRSHHL